MKKPNCAIRIGLLLAMLMLPFAAMANAADTTADDLAAIEVLLQDYQKLVATADIELAAKLWAEGENTSLINPKLHMHGTDAVVNKFFGKVIVNAFSKRNLIFKDTKIFLLGDQAAWVESNWDFYATIRKDNKDIHNQGRITQVLSKTPQGWRIVHVHYSGMPEETK